MASGALFGVNGAPRAPPRGLAVLPGQRITHARPRAPAGQPARAGGVFIAARRRLVPQGPTRKPIGARASMPRLCRSTKRSAPAVSGHPAPAQFSRPKLTRARATHPRAPCPGDAPQSYRPKKNWRRASTRSGRRDEGNDEAAEKDDAHRPSFWLQPRQTRAQTPHFFALLTKPIPCMPAANHKICCGHFAASACPGKRFRLGRG